ncbi:DnaJ domain-containing protein [Bacteroidota bacterium]
MKDYYQILGVDRYATGSQIKRAYRELALKYHPDKSRSAATHQKFTEINEAYHTLNDKDKRENFNLIYDYNQQVGSQDLPDSIFSKWSDYSPKEAGKRYYRPAYAKKEETVDLRPYVKSVRIISSMSLILTILVIMDHVLPEQTFDQTIISKLTTYKSTNTIFIETERFEFPLSYTHAKLIRTGDEARIHLSPIFNIPEKLVVNSGDDKYIFSPHYSIYNVFSFFLIILLATSYIGMFQKKTNPELIFSAGVANVALSLLIIYLINAA